MLLINLVDIVNFLGLIIALGSLIVAGILAYWAGRFALDLVRNSNGITLPLLSLFSASAMAYLWLVAPYALLLYTLSLYPIDLVIVPFMIIEIIQIGLLSFLIFALIILYRGLHR